jgi:eukaryotic-like serine/threonine-protein kinase
MKASMHSGKEEIRASILKTYWLRLRAERGEGAVQKLLTQTGLEQTTALDERAWLSTAAATRVLKALQSTLGPEALQDRGEWATHPEALGTMVRMLRSAKIPRDAYVHLADNTKEVSRVGSWEVESSTERSVVILYKHRSDADDGPENPSREEELLLCSARIGELRSYPRIWGLENAVVEHPMCLAKKGEHCLYNVSWAAPKSSLVRERVILAFLAVSFGCLMWATGSVVSGLLAAIVVAVLGTLVLASRTKSSLGTANQVFERNRVAALERGLELKGELGQAPPAGELFGSVLGGKYRIGRKIGSGGIGVVYAAEHTSLGHEVAIKVLRGAAARDGSEIARLRREAHIQTHVDHPNVARVLDLDQMPDGSIYVVMERLVGRSLADRLQREGLVPPGRAIPIFIDVCKGLAAAHGKNVVHRDLKPGNIFLCDDGSSKVLDFGMSKLTNAEALTQQGYTLGTPEYMAPEQCIGAPVEARTDLYALGVLMYESLTGELPIASTNRRELLDLHQRRVPDHMRDKRPDLPIPEALDYAIMRCLEKRADDRPASATALAELLSAIPLQGLPVTYPPGIARKRMKDLSHTPGANAGTETLSVVKSDRPPESDV